MYLPSTNRPVKKRRGWGEEAYVPCPGASRTHGARRCHWRPLALALDHILEVSRHVVFSHDPLQPGVHLASVGDGSIPAHQWSVATAEEAEWPQMLLWWEIRHLVVEVQKLRGHCKHSRGHYKHSKGRHRSFPLPDDADPDFQLCDPALGATDGLMRRPGSKEVLGTLAAPDSNATLRKMNFFPNMTRGEVPKKELGLKDIAPMALSKLATFCSSLNAASHVFQPCECIGDEAVLSANDEATVLSTNVNARSHPEQYCPVGGQDFRYGGLVLSDECGEVLCTGRIGGLGFDHDWSGLGL